MPGPHSGRLCGIRVVAWTLCVKRPDGAGYDVPLMDSAVRASPRSQAWAWSVS